MDDCDACNELWRQYAEAVNRHAETFTRLLEAFLDGKSRPKVDKFESECERTARARNQARDGLRAHLAEHIQAASKLDALISKSGVPFDPKAGPNT